MRSGAPPPGLLGQVLAFLYERVRCPDDDVLPLDLDGEVAFVMESDPRFGRLLLSILGGGLAGV